MSATATAPRRQRRSPAEIFDVGAGIRLHRLTADSDDLYPVPIVLVPSLLSKWYVFDIHPARSMAAFLRDHQFDVWVVDWAEPEKKRPTPGFEEYVDDYLGAAIDDITGAVDVDQVSLLGYSLGGVLATVFTASYPERIRNLITLTTPIDFHRTGLTAVWARYFPIDPFVDFWGNVPGWFIKANFRVAAIGRLPALWSAFSEDMKTVEGRAVLAEIRRWIGDTVPVAGELYRTLVRDCYKHNMLLRGGLPVGGRTVGLDAITSSILTITAGEDPLCPAASAEALNRAASSTDETAISVPGSHLGAVIGQKAHHLLWTRIVNWLEPRSGHHPSDWYGGER